MGESTDPICYAPKTRYLSIARHPEEAPNTARRISLDADPTPIVLGWVGEPEFDALEGLWSALLVGTPTYAGVHFESDWPDVVHVKGCEVAPGHTYELQAIQNGSDESDESYYSEVLALKTAPVWGDIVSTCAFFVCLPPEGDPFTQPNIDDVLVLVNAFQGIRAAPLTWLDVDPVVNDGYPEGVVTIGDVLVLVNAFTGESYPGLGPLACE
jgi:hypothetical protein